MTVEYNFVAVAKNTAKLSGTFSSFGTVTGGEPQNLDDLPHLSGCLAFLDQKTGFPLREARDAGRRWLAEDTAPDVDTSE